MYWASLCLVNVASGPWNIPSCVIPSQCKEVFASDISSIL